MNERASLRRGLAAALVVAGVLLVGTALLARGRAAEHGSERAHAAGAGLRARLEQAVRAATRAIEPKAMAASRLQGIVSGLDLDADPHTFEDLLENEDWWAPVRAEFPISGVVAASGSLAMRGLDAGDLGGTPVVRQARELGVASAVVSLEGRGLMLAAARVPPGKRGASDAVVVLGAPVDSVVLQTIGDAAQAPVALSDGKRLLATAGPADAQPALAAIVGREESSTGDAPTGTLALSLDRGLWLLSLVPGGAPSAGMPRLTLILIGSGGALVLLGLALSLRTRRQRERVADGPGGQPLATRHPEPAQKNRPSSVVGPPVAATPAGVARTESAPVIAIGIGSPPRPVSRASDRSSAVAFAGPAAKAVAAVAPDPALASAVSGAPATLGRYRLLERIGEGGMAEIFVAAAHGAEGFVRYFVVKRMHAHLTRNRDAVNHFIDEARLQSGLVHSNIVPVFDFGRAGDEYFLALEYIHGADLERLVRRHVETLGRPLGAPIAFYLMHEVLDALAYAHGRSDHDGRGMGIVHRDVAPGNILVSLRGEVKLSDFGIAKAEGRLGRSELGTIKGNVSFMSPEQARGEAVDLRSDLFSVGVVLYYCLTGQLLYRDETMFNRLVRAAIGPAISEFTELDGLPAPAVAVLKRALSLDPALRYQSAREFARDLSGQVTAGRSELAELMESLFPDLRKEGR